MTATPAILKVTIPVNGMTLRDIDTDAAGKLLGDVLALARETNPDVHCTDIKAEFSFNGTP